MSVLPVFPVEGVEEQQEPHSRTYRLDLETGRIRGMVDGLEAVNQAIQKALLTPRFRCMIYDNQYGSELKQIIIAEDVTPEFVETEVPRLVQEALLADSRVLEVADFALDIAGERVSVRFTAETIFGETTIEEVL